MTESLPLVGDGDEIDLLQAIEAAFGVCLTREEAERCVTVGDMHAVLLSKVRHVERGALPCPTATAFRRLRRAIEKLQPGQVVRPDTEIVTLLAGGGAGRRWRRLQLETGLRLPSAGSGSFLLLMACIGTPFFAYPFVGWLSSLGLLLSIPLAFFLNDRLPISPPSRYDTVGDLARAAAGLNISSLSWPAGAMRTRDVWSALEAIIRDELDWDGPVSPEMRLVALR
jgi:hypothetical protein